MRVMVVETGVTVMTVHGVTLMTVETGVACSCDSDDRKTKGD